MRLKKTAADGPGLCGIQLAPSVPQGVEWRNKWLCIKMLWIRFLPLLFDFVTFNLKYKLHIRYLKSMKSSRTNVIMVIKDSLSDYIEFPEQPLCVSNLKHFIFLKRPSSSQPSTR